MGLLDNLKQQIGSQFIEILQWLDDTNDSLVYRFPVYNQEIKMNAQLTVRENQVALLINEGRAADLFSPGRYQLTTQNMPILTTLRGWKYGFQSPFKAEVYFFNTRLFTDLKWGTTNPVMMRDAEFGMIRLRAFGTYAMKIADAKAFFAAIVGTAGLTTTDEITGQLRSTILSRLSDAIAESKIAALDKDIKRMKFKARTIKKGTKALARIEASIDRKIADMAKLIRAADFTPAVLNAGTLYQTSDLFAALKTSA